MADRTARRKKAFEIDRGDVASPRIETPHDATRDGAECPPQPPGHPRDEPGKSNAEPKGYLESKP